MPPDVLPLLPDGGQTIRVDWRASMSLVGTVLKFLAVPLLVPLAVALYYGTDVPTFAVSVALTFLVGVGLERLDPDPDIGAREGFLMVAATWLFVSLMGAVPYLLAAHGIPMLFGPTSPTSTLADPVNALFESMSGVTTTGATVLGDISFDTHSRAILLWRQLSQWLGGMGIVVLALAILPELSVGGAQLMEAEAPGVGIEKLTPRIAETARVLWLIYFGLTLLEILILYGMHLVGPLVGWPDLAPNMTLYNAVAHGLTTMPTGGFSPEAESIAAFSGAVQWVVIPFMFAAGTNFALFWRVFSGEPRTLFEDAEFKAYFGVVGIFTAILAGMLFTGMAPVLDLGGVTQGNFENALRQAVFQVLAMVTTTGYATSDFAQWGTAGEYFLLFAMFVGGSGGSTGGGIKIIRWVVILKSARRELFTTVHPEAVRPVRLGDLVIDESAVRGIYAFTLVYFLLFGVSTVFIVVAGGTGDETLTVLEGMSAAASTIGNVGPGFGDLGPFGSYLWFPDTSKLLMVFLMWVGRLEIIPVLVLLTTGYWRS
jgi:trk system potassium uptake protein TrkH